ncbi:hypothetical protein N7478_012935 [Penicillium angulare]|uniref:uncharacterized protein n=1 Tax=Penicillium angulare TaxID=116970 RepID=UPI00253FCFDA|nr:uncharacterized protein N7478_012935 [Penicillium angulare]KAJ5256831.1 hypothetical protein N7478_012935 [Penicillium angulare]
MPRPNLASTFVVLLEYTKLAQPLHLHHDIALLHGGLVSSLALPQYCSIAAPDNESSLSIKSEMDRRAQVYGFCAAATNSFWLKTLPMLQFPSAGIHFPRPRSIQVSPLVNSHNTSSGDSFPPAQEILTSYRSLLTPRSNGHDSQPLNLSYDETFVLAMTHMSQVSILEGLADTSIEADGHNRHLHAIAMLTRELDMREANTSQAKIKVPKTLSRDIRALLQLMAIRNHFHGGLYDSHALFRNDASLLASDISTHIGPFAPSLDSTLCLLEDCVRNLEQPATTGVAFFLRTHMSSWGLEIALSTFESALFLAKWINQLQSVAMPSQFAWSSVDMVDRTPLCRSFLEISISLLKFWSYVFMSMENKEYVKFLGETLLNYADILASPAEI